MAIRLFKILGVLSLIVVTLALILPDVTRGRHAVAVRRTQCKNNFKQILLAMANYESKYGALPPAHTIDANGNPLHSWRTLILPYLDQKSLYHSIDLSKPWNDPANREAYNSVVPVFCCPATIYPDGKPSWPSNKTTYMAVVTPDSCLRSTEARALSDIKDSHSETLLLIEVAPESAVHWMAPVDADEALALNFGASSKRTHQGGANVGLVDGTVRFINTELSTETIRALISIAGHESVGHF